MSLRFSFGSSIQAPDPMTERGRLQEQPAVRNELGNVFEVGYAGNVFIRRISLPAAGVVLPGHRHNFPHASHVERGPVSVRHWLAGHSKPLQGTRYHTGEYFEVPALAYHEIEALADGCEVHCIFAMRDTDGQVAEMVTDWHRSAGAERAHQRLGAE